MKCNKCGKECMESELTNGICYECSEKVQKNSEISKVVEKLKKEEPTYTNDKNINALSQTYKVLSSIFLTVSIIGSIIIGIIFENIWLGIASFISILFFSLFLQTASEILQLLEDIKNK